MNRIISLDMDGTIVKQEWIDYIWNNAIPELYAEQEGIDLEEAKLALFKAYDEVGKGDIRWYQIPYWFDRFKIKKDPKEFIAERADRIELYEDALDALRSLKKAVISTNAPRELADVEIEIISKYTEVIKTYSAVSDFGMLKKDPQFYKEVYEDLKRKGLVAEPSGIVHIGDDYLNDYIAPLRAGMGAYYLDRSKIDLYELLKVAGILT